MPTALSLDLSSSLALEAVGKQALSFLQVELNDEIVAVQQEWAVLDAKLEYQPIDVEMIMPENFYHGHRPSLIDAPVEAYPNCSVMAFSASPQISDWDHEDRYSLRLFVELMCKSDSDEGEVNSRIQRTADAAHRVLMRNPSLGGLVDEVANTPTLEVSDVFTRMEQTRSGHKFFWQGARLEYTIMKYANR